MLKNKLITIGSLASLVVGVLGAFLIYVWVDNEVSTDKFHSNVDNIYMTVSQQSLIDNPEPINTQRFFKVDYSQYPQVTNRVSTSLYNQERIKLKKGDQEFRGRGLITDSTFFEIFDFEFVVGERLTVLNDPKSLILTENMAKKIFGTEEPLGQTLFLECDRKGFYEVAAILKDIPSNSSIHFDFIVPAHSQEWWGISSEEFLLVKDNFNKPEFNEAIKHLGRSHQQFKESTLSTVAFRDVYFDQPFSRNLFVKYGDRGEVNTLILVALVVLIVSIFNFTNLQTTLVYSQLKTRGIKQVNGATRFDFMLEVMVNRLIFSVLCIGFVFLLFELIKPSYLGFLEISQNFSALDMLLLLSIGVTAFMILSGILTLLQASKIVTANALIGSLGSNRKRNSGRVLTTLQYVLATTLIIATTFVFKQFTYMQNKDLGFEPDDIISVKFFDDLPYDFKNPEAYKAARQKQINDYKLVKSELVRTPGVSSYSQGPLPIDGSASTMSWKLANGDFEYSEVNLISLEPQYADLLGLSILQGRFFSDSLDKSRQHKVVLNEAAMSYWNLEEFDGQKVASSSWSGEEDPWHVIGVTQNFHYEHLSKKVKPLIMVYFNDMEEEFLIRLNKERFKSALASVETLFNQVNPKGVFEYTLLETKVQAQYNREKKLSQIFVLFTLTGLIISSIGLFTFALYETRKRIKEIGIRKVVGATVREVGTLLSASFVKWVALAFLIACPLSWYLMSNWLANFANQTILSWWVFVGAGVLTTLLALITVIGQTYLAAKQNPVEALRYE